MCDPGPCQSWSQTSVLRCMPSRGRGQLFRKAQALKHHGGCQPRAGRSPLPARVKAVVDRMLSHLSRQLFWASRLLSGTLFNLSRMGTETR